MTTVLVAVALGLAAGVLAGMFGVGGGVLFVPTLVALGLTQIEAEATSLLAILPTVAAGTWRQRRYGHIRWRAALVIGLASVPAAALGAWAAIELGNEALRRLFGLLVLGVAAQLAWKARGDSSPPRAPVPPVSGQRAPAAGDPPPASRLRRCSHE